MRVHAMTHTHWPLGPDGLASWVCSCGAHREARPVTRAYRDAATHQRVQTARAHLRRQARNHP